MNYNTIITEYKDKVCYITINRPKYLNALNIKMISELNTAISLADKDRNIRCIILTGFGNIAFAAGADIKEFMLFNKQEGEKLSRDGQENVFDLLENLGTPSIAAINGFALGGGLELAMSCHMRIASSNSKMGLPEVSLGVIPGYGGTQRLPQLVGKGKALEMILTGNMILASEAKEIGLVNHVCEQEKLIGFSLEIANKIIKNSSKAICKAIKSLNTGFYNRKDGFEQEKKLFGSCFETDEFIEGTNAFIEKRKPEF